MKRVRGIIMLLGLIASGGFTLPVVAQESGEARATNLRAQLVEVQAKQTELQMRLQQLAEELKPENIERALAGIGSTHPEDLRAQRRRQLEIEKKGVESQLDTLAASRARLGAIDTALKSLRRALDIQPTLRIRAQRDQDLNPLRSDPEFDQLVFAARD